MTPTNDDTREEVRILIFDNEECAAVVEGFMAAGIAAFADYRCRRERVDDLIADAIKDGVDYIVSRNWRTPLDKNEIHGQSSSDLLVDVFSSRDGQRKTMRTSQAVAMVQQRRAN